MRVYIYLFVNRWRFTALYPDDFYSVSPCTIWWRIGIPCRERAYHLAEWFFAKLDCRNVPLFPIRTPCQFSVNIGFISEIPLLITCVISIILP